MSGNNALPATPAAVRDYAHIGLTYVLAFYFNQPNTTSLTGLLEKYAGYGEDVLDRLQFVLVDDGSPVVASLPALPLNILRLRVREDIPWNQPGARNLGIVYARSDKILVTDLDHEFSEETLRYILNMPPPGRTIYKMRRWNQDGTTARPHPNTFVLSRSRFLRLYGYDEEFCGHYGYDDAMFWRWQRYHGTFFRYLPRRCSAVSREKERADSYHTLTRDLSFNAVVAARKRDEWRLYGPNAGHSRRFLQFTWDTVSDSVRPAPPPLTNRTWTATWLWRSLWPQS